MTSLALPIIARKSLVLLAWTLGCMPGAAARACTCVRVATGSGGPSRRFRYR